MSILVENALFFVLIKKTPLWGALYVCGDLRWVVAHLGVEDDG
jgi:hypothetical protein